MSLPIIKKIVINTYFYIKIKIKYGCFIFSRDENENVTKSKSKPYYSSCWEWKHIEVN